LRQNKISSFQEIDHLRDLPHLTALSLTENPIASEPNYREIVLRKVPQLRKLDEIDVAVKVDTFPVNENAANGAIGDRLLPRPPVLHPSGSSGMKAQFNLGPIVRQFQEEGAQAQRLRAREDLPCLTAVLALIPELTAESLQVVLESIQRLCSSS
jgi:Leucine-rich repeat (LRR) protein